MYNVVEEAAVQKLQGGESTHDALDLVPGDGPAQSEIYDVTRFVQASSIKSPNDFLRCL
jgi:hypothetical protein